MSLALVTDDHVTAVHLRRCASTVHAEYRRSLDALEESIDRTVAVGRALSEARAALPSDHAFGLWFRDQNFGFTARHAWTLRQVAEHESEVRAMVGSRLPTGKPNLETALKTIRAAHAASIAEEASKPMPSALALASTTGTRQPVVTYLDEIRRLANNGADTVEVAAALGMSTGHVSNIAHSHGIPLGKKSRAAILQRVERMRALAAEGATSQQIAAELRIGEPVVRRYAETYDIKVPADAATSRRTIDSTRLVASTIDAVDGIGRLFDLIDFPALPAEEVNGWVDVLSQSIRSLTTLKKRLKELTQP